MGDNSSKFTMVHGFHSLSSPFQLVEIKRNDVHESALKSERYFWIRLQPHPAILHFKEMNKRSGTRTFREGRLTIRVGGDRATFRPFHSSRAHLLAKMQTLSGSQKAIVRKLLAQRDRTDGIVGL